jgi:hypothetical protein
MRRYKIGMNEIVANEALKQKIMYRVKEQDQGSYVINLKKAAIFFTAVSLFILAAMFGYSYYQDSASSKAAQTQTEFHGIYLTAFSADGTPSLVKPNIPFGKYSMMMSNVPGFPLKIDCIEADTIHLQAAGGVFELWSSLSSQIDNKGKTIAIHSGDTVYWSPVDTDSAKTTIVITAFKKDKEIGSKTIEISRDEGVTYTGMLVE